MHIRHSAAADRSRGRCFARPHPIRRALAGNTGVRTVSMRSELGESPRIVGQLLAASGQVQAVARAVRAREIDLAVIAARGTSDHCGPCMPSTSSVRATACWSHPRRRSLVSLYGAPPRLCNALVIGISQSGRSPDVVARARGVTPAGRADRGHHERPGLGAGGLRGVPRRARRPAKSMPVAATKTYLAETAVIAMLSAALSGDEASQDELRAIPAALEAALEQEAVVASIAESWARENRCAVARPRVPLWRGPRMGPEAQGTGLCPG